MALEAAIASLAETAHAVGATAIEQVKEVNRLIPKISHAAIGHGAALAFNAVRIYDGLDLRNFDIFEVEIEDEVEETVGIMKEAGKDLTDVVNCGIPIENMQDWEDQ